MSESTTEQPARHRVGDAIALEDFLALPPDGNRYVRDAQGRLAIMPPDDPSGHRFPLGELLVDVAHQLGAGWRILPEPAIAFDPILDLQGRPLPPSRLGRKALVPDLVVFRDKPKLLPHRPGSSHRLFASEGVALVVELLSRDTHRSDLGLGKADRVDRHATYLANGVAEYWVLNASTRRLTLPPRSGLFLRRTPAGAWAPLEVEGAREAGEPGPHGLSPILAGRVCSEAVPGLSLDLAPFWDGLDLEEA